jgi:UDP-N-acetylglucosamine 2-epimerase
MKIVTIVGARPQFIKAAPVSKILRKYHKELLINTGQHYDPELSTVFYHDLALPYPDINLQVGSGTHGVQTGTMLIEIEKVLEREKPDWVLVYGDTNSTLAGGLAAAKMHIRLAHVEAGLRSFNRNMPEEINRVLTDHLSELLFCPSSQAVDNLKREGIIDGVHEVGDVMADALAQYRLIAQKESTIIKRLQIEPKRYLLLTLHRAENTEDASKLFDVLSALEHKEEKVIFPVHPRTQKLLSKLNPPFVGKSVHTILPLGYLDMIQLISHARVVLTDSGGLQKEAYWLEVPCLTLREETEWVETVQTGWNRLVGTDRSRIKQALAEIDPPEDRPTLYGDGKAAERIVNILSSVN